MIDNKYYCRKYLKEKIFYYSNVAFYKLLKKELMKLKYNTEVLSEDRGSRVIFDLLQSDNPFLVSRFGGTEIRTVADVLYERAGGHIGGLTKKSRNRIVNLSGFFPNDKELICKFADTYIEAMKNIDVLGVWRVFMQKEMINMFLPDSRLIKLNILDSFLHSFPWTYGLKDKKVLVIHPFSSTIEKQYINRDKLFDNEKILPDFELQTLRAVQTLAGHKDDRYNDWFEALEDMFENAMKKDFDVALIGCGAYGLPLANKLKNEGKQVIHIGGSLQLLFGIKGKRWDDDVIISKFYNNNWVRPNKEDQIEKYKIVEKGCYW